MFARNHSGDRRISWTSLETDAPSGPGRTRPKSNQVLLNLGINSWHAMKDRPRDEIEFQARAAYGRRGGGRAHTGAPAGRAFYARLSVSGHGIAAWIDRPCSAIFEPFLHHQAPRAKARGLGLAVVHGIMESPRRCSGRFTASLARAPCFHLYFSSPRGARPKSPWPQHSFESPPRGYGERILFVGRRGVIGRARTGDAHRPLATRSTLSRKPHAALETVFAPSHRSLRS